MNEHTHTMSRGARPLDVPDAACTASNGVVFIGTAEVMLGTTVATSRVPPHGSLRTWWSRIADACAERRSVVRRRPDYIEHAAMAREMHRL